MDDSFTNQQPYEQVAGEEVVITSNENDLFQATSTDEQK